MRGRRQPSPSRHRRYVGAELAAVLEQVEAAHGTGARIVGVDRIRQGGVAGFFARECYEVTVEVAPGAGPGPARGGSRPDTAVPPLPPVASRAGAGPVGPAAPPPGTLSFSELLARRLAETDDLDDEAAARAGLRRALLAPPPPAAPSAARHRPVPPLPPPHLAFDGGAPNGGALDDGVFDDLSFDGGVLDDLSCDGGDFDGGSFDEAYAEAGGGPDRWMAVWDDDGDDEGLVDFEPDAFRPHGADPVGPHHSDAGAPVGPAGSGDVPPAGSASGGAGPVWFDEGAIVDDGVDPDGVDLDFEPGYPVVVDQDGFVTVPGLRPGPWPEVHDEPATGPVGDAGAIDLAGMGLDDITFSPGPPPAVDPFDRAEIDLDLDAIDLDAVGADPADGPAADPGARPADHAHDRPFPDDQPFPDDRRPAEDGAAGGPGTGPASGGAATGAVPRIPVGPAFGPADRPSRPQPGRTSVTRPRLGSVDDWSLYDADHRLVPTGAGGRSVDRWGPAEAGGLAFWARYDQARAEAELLAVPAVALSAVVGPLAATVDVVQRCQANHWSGGCDVFVLSERVALRRGGPDRSWRFVHHPDQLLAVVTGQQAEFPLLVIDVPEVFPTWLRPLLTRLRSAGLGLVRYVLDGDPTDEDLATWHGEIGRPAVLDLSVPLAPARVLELVDRGEPITSVAGLPLDADLLLALRAEVGTSGR